MPVRKLIGLLRKRPKQGTILKNTLKERISNPSTYFSRTNTGNVRVLVEKLSTSRHALTTQLAMPKRDLFTAEKNLRTALKKARITTQNDLLNSREFLEFRRKVSSLAEEKATQSQTKVSEKLLAKYVSDFGWMVFSELLEHKKVIETSTNLKADKT